MADGRRRLAGAVLPRRTARFGVPGLFAALMTVVVLFAFAATALATPANVRVRVEGESQTVYAGTAAAQSVVMTDSDGVGHPMDGNALWALGRASVQGGFPYVLKDSAWGLYIDSVDGELPVPTPPYPGWLYRVNGVSPLVGADQYVLNAGDDVLWYYGTYDASPTVAVVPLAPVAASTAVTITAQQLDPAGVASPLPGATVHLGSATATADDQGRAAFVTGAVGDYDVRVEMTGHIRSAVQTLRVRVLTDARVWRFYNRLTGTHFYTASEAEKNDVLANLSAIYQLDGLAYTVREASAENDTPLYRFYNRRTGTHFYTASEAEKNRVLNTLSSEFTLEGVAYYVSDTAPAGARPVWRFYNRLDGTHFYTSDPAEKAHVESALSATYQLDGVGYYLAP